LSKAHEQHIKKSNQTFAISSTVIQLTNGHCLLVFLPSSSPPSLHSSQSSTQKGVACQYCEPTRHQSPSTYLTPTETKTMFLHPRNLFLRKHRDPTILQDSAWVSPRMAFAWPDSSFTTDHDDGSQACLLQLTNETTTTLSSSQLGCNMSFDTNETVDSDDGDDENNPVINNTGSTSFFFLRKRSHEEQKMISQQRAAVLIAQYEMSDDKEQSLNRHAKFGPTPLPSLGACLGAQQATLVSLKELQTSDEESLEPTKSTFHHISNKGKAAAGSITKNARLPLHSKGNVFTFTLADAKATMIKKSRAQQRIELAHAARLRLQANRISSDESFSDEDDDNELGMNVALLSPSVHSTLTEPTMANTPSPRHPSVSMPGSKLRAMQTIHRLC
jgi:hypothetical protein